MAGDINSLNLLVTMLNLKKAPIFPLTIYPSLLAALKYLSGNRLQQKISARALLARSKILYILVLFIL